MPHKGVDGLLCVQCHVRGLEGTEGDGVEGFSLHGTWAL